MKGNSTVRIARDPAPTNPLFEESAWVEADLEASSTFDVCAECAETYGLDDGADWPEDGRDLSLVPFNGEPTDGDWVVSVIEHPPYDDDEYLCEVCRDRLQPGRDD